MNNTLKRRFSTLVEKENDDNNKKKRRCAFEINNDVSICNEIGIMQFKAGQHADAKRSFFEALSKEKENTPSSASQPFSAHNLLKIKSLATGLWTSSSADEYHSLEKTLSYVYQRQMYDEGMNVYNATLHTHNLISAEQRCATLLYNIGQTCARKKDYDGAKAWFEFARAILCDCEHDSMDVDCVNIVKLHHNLGYCSYRLGDKDDAMEQYRQALALVQNLCIGKRDLAAAYNCVAVLHFHNGRSEAAAALDLFRKSLNILRSLAEDCTREIGTVINNMGRVYFMQSNFDQALREYKNAIEVRCQTLGPDSIDVAATVFNTAQTYQKLGMLENAMECYQQFVDIAGRQLGFNNRDIAAAYKCMARICTEGSQTKKARSLYMRALESERAVSSTCYSDIASTLNELGALCYKMNEVDAALNYFREGLKEEKACQCPNTTNIVTTLRNIAQIHKCNGDYGEALDVFNEVKMIQSRVHGFCSLEVASTLASMGLMNYLNHDFSSSLTCYQETLLVYREYYGSDDHHDIASTLNLIGLVLYKLTHYELSKSTFAKSLSVWRKLGLVNREIADLWYNIATVYLETGDEEQAINFYKESLRLEEQILGKDNPELCSTIQHLGHVHQRRGDFNEAIKYFRSALDIEETVGGEASVSVFRLLNMIGIIYFMKGDVGKMMECFVKATRSRLSPEHFEQYNSLVASGHNSYALSNIHPECAAVA